MPAEYTTGGRLLSLNNISLTLGGRKILRDITIGEDDLIRPDMVGPGKGQGQVIGILGPSGAGKTQLFKIISGVQTPDTGEVLIGQKQLKTKQGNVGLVTQTSLILRHRTVLNNLVFAGRKGGMTRGDATEKALHYLERFGLLAQKDFWPAQLSGGMRQRVAILQQVMVGHELICMDEPFSGLDVRMTDEVIKLIQELTCVNEYLTIIVVTHSIQSAISCADHLWLLGKKEDESGHVPEGSTIATEYDLIALDLAWHEDIRHQPNFATLVSQITERFKTL